MIHIFHIYANQINLGDWGSAIGIKKMLRNASHEDVRFEDFFIQDKFSDKKINELNEKFDAIIIGGGGLYKIEHNLRDKLCRKWPFGILLNIKEDQLKKIKIPIFIYAAGLNRDLDIKRKIDYTDINNIYFTKKQVNNIRKLHSYIDLISVRDTASNGFLSEIDPDTNFYLTPCPSMFISPDNSINYGENNKIRIGLNFKNLDTLNLDNIKKIIDILKDKRYEINYINHNSKLDNFSKNISYELKIKLVSSKDPFELAATYKSMDYTIGMRGHSNIFSFGSNIPFISLSYNVKCDFFCDMVDMNKYLLRTNEKWTTSNFLSIFYELIENERKTKEKFSKLITEFYYYNKNYCKKILNNI